ncbi:MAG: YciI family protein [Prosthecobacter sp.]|nr:YciI family protein [Prosthecobacter sp.]
MSTEQNTYLLLSRGKWDPAAEKADIEAAIDKFYTWYEANITAGRFKPGSRLTMDAALVTRDGIRTDGPFAEGKEVIGGYWIIVAESLAAASALVAESPVLAHGICYEIRPLESERGSAYRLTNETPVE